MGVSDVIVFIRSLCYSRDADVLFGCYADGSAAAWESEPSRSQPRLLPAHALLWRTPTRGKLHQRVFVSQHFALTVCRKVKKSLPRSATSQKCHNVPSFHAAKKSAHRCFHEMCQKVNKDSFVRHSVPKNAKTCLHIQIHRFISSRSVVLYTKTEPMCLMVEKRASIETA